jgi:hypothetical protein
MKSNEKIMMKMAPFRGVQDFRLNVCFISEKELQYVNLNLLEKNQGHAHSIREHF